MRRKILVLTLAAIMALTMALAGPASAQIGLPDLGTSLPGGGTSNPDIDFDLPNVPNSCEAAIIEEIAQDRGISEERADRIFDKLRAGQVEDLVEEVCG